MASLEELRKQARKRYADYPVDLDDGTTVVLRAPLRLSSDERTELREMQSTINAMQDDTEGYKDSDLLEVLRDIVRTVAHDKDRAEVLIESISDDLSILQTLFEEYTEETQSGEASNSAG